MVFATKVSYKYVRCDVISSSSFLSTHTSVLSHAVPLDPFLERIPLFFKNQLPLLLLVETKGIYPSVASCTSQDSQVSPISEHQ